MRMSILALAVILLGGASAQSQPRQADGIPNGVPPIAGGLAPGAPVFAPDLSPTAPVVEGPRLECQSMPGFVIVQASRDLCVFRTERPMRQQCACGDGVLEWYDFNAVRADNRSVPQWRSEVTGTCTPCPDLLQ